MPVVAVLGNHEYAAHQVDEVAAAYRQAGIRLLDGTTTDFIIRGESLGIVGTRGARGGFGEHALEPTGEAEVDLWLYAARSEAAKIEAGLGEPHNRLPCGDAAPLAHPRNRRGRGPRRGSLLWVERAYANQ